MIKGEDDVFRTSTITVELPNGTLEELAFPKKVKLGGKYNAVKIVEGKMVTIAFERVRGGWRLIQAQNGLIAK